MNHCTLDTLANFDFFQKKMAASDKLTMKRYFNFKTKAETSFLRFISDFLIFDFCEWRLWTELKIIKKMKPNFGVFQVAFLNLGQKSCRIYGGSNADDWSTKLQKKEWSTPSSLKKPKVLLRKFIKTFYPPPAVWYVSHLLLVDKIQLSWL